MAQDQIKVTTGALLFAENFHGKLKPEIIKRVERFLNKPSTDTWEDIAGIIISKRQGIITIWNAVIAYDQTFPMSGRRTDRAGKMLKDWTRIPTTDQLTKAIGKVVYSELYTAN